MARTKASVGSKISSGKSSKARCSVAPAGSGGSSGNSDKSSRGSGGGNPVCPRETPKWQKPITNFFINRHNDGEDKGDGGAAGSSKPKPKPKRNIINFDDESPEKPKNSVLEESIVLEELNGEDSHKIEEYYTKKSKGKSAAKKTKKTNRSGSKRATETEDIDDGKGEEETGNNEEMTENDLEQTENSGEGTENDEEEIENTEKETENDEELSENDEEETENDEKLNKVEDNLKKDLTETVDKENIDSNKKSNTNDKDNNNKNKNKREREDELEEGNVRKKIKIK